MCGDGGGGGGNGGQGARVGRWWGGGMVSAALKFYEESPRPIRKIKTPRVLKGGRRRDRAKTRGIVL